MTGAVIGDLAAWTWEHDRTCFYERLVSSDARLSGYGLFPIVMWEKINDYGLIHKNRMYVKIGKALMHARPAGINIPDSWRIWGMSEYDNPMPFDLKIALISSAFIDSGFLSKEQQQQLDWVSFFHGGKQEYYASNIMVIIRKLNEGATKDECIEGIPSPLINYYQSGKSHAWKDYLEYITFAWRCFYYSWDFTSALYNAAKCSANRHLAMMITGAFAEAMYGCTYSMTKQKFGGRYELIEIPATLPTNFIDQLNEIKAIEYQERHFFKKNDALSNVERYNWTDVENPYSDQVIDRVFKKTMMRAYFTGWENRYGVYLDNGWFYVYRSHYILLRYKLLAQSDNTFRISNLQISNDDHARVEDLQEVLYCLNSND